MFTTAAEEHFYLHERQVVGRDGQEVDDVWDPHHVLGEGSIQGE